LLNLAVIVAVIAVRMMQVAVHQVVHVIAMRDGLVPATRSVLVALVVTAAVMARSASRGVGAADRQRMFLDRVAVLVVQMAVVQAIDVPFVDDPRVPAVGAVRVRVPFMVFRHRQSSPSRVGRAEPSCNSSACPRVLNQFGNVAICENR
jgi:hypothetical protein